MRLSNKSVLTAALFALLAGCNLASGGGDAPRTSGPVDRPASVAVPDTPVRVGAPYSIDGRTYTPVDQVDYDEVGYASWYGSELDGEPTASGEPFRANWVSAAHRILPLPAYVEVSRLDTGRTILVRVNDRGPADPNRLIDLSAAAAEQLGITEAGMAQVRVRRTNPPESERLVLRSGQLVFPRLDTTESLLEILRERADRLPRPNGYATRPGPPAPATTPAIAPAPAGTGPFVVQVAAFSDRGRAEALARRLGAQVIQSGAVYRVRFGPFASEAEAQAAIAHARSLGQPGAIIQRQQ